MKSALSEITETGQVMGSLYATHKRLLHNLPSKLNAGLLYVLKKMYDICSSDKCYC